MCEKTVAGCQVYGECLMGYPHDAEGAISALKADVARLEALVKMTRLYMLVADSCEEHIDTPFSTPEAAEAARERAEQEGWFAVVYEYEPSPDGSFKLKKRED